MMLCSAKFTSASAWMQGCWLSAEPASRVTSDPPPHAVPRSGQQQAQRVEQVAGAVRPAVQPCPHGQDRQLRLHGACEGIHSACGVAELLGVRLPLRDKG